MKFRPSIELRFRDAQQLEKVSQLAAEAGVSRNEWIILQVDPLAPAAPEEKVVKAKEK